MASGYGTLFRLTSNGGLTTLVSFNGTNGSGPSGLAQGSDGSFYGSTQSGGQGYTGPAYSGHGTLFSIAPDGTLTTLFSFNGTNGRSPWAGLIQASDGNFYGTTSRGGTNYSPMLPGLGTIFKLTPGGVLTTLVSFNGTNGSHPYAGLIQASDGNFYGTTYNGGADYTTPSSGSGTVFKLTPDGVLTTLVFFNGTNGSRPYAGLAQGSDGSFYGTTVLGGVNGNGTVFKLAPGGVMTTLISFNGMNGSRPFAGLVQGSDGNFYGTADFGGLGGGTIFRLVEPPVIKQIAASHGNVNLTWTSFTNGTYRVEYKPSLSATAWLAVAPDVTATGNLSSVAHSVANVAERYYQVRLLP